MTTKHQMVPRTKGQGREPVRMVRARRLRGGGPRSDCRWTRGRMNPAWPTRLLERLGAGVSMVERAYWAKAAQGPLPDRVQLPRCQAAPGAGRLPNPHRGPLPLPPRCRARSPDLGPPEVAPCRRPRAGTLFDSQHQTQGLPATGGQACCNERAGLLPAKNTRPPCRVLLALGQIEPPPN